MALPFIEFNYNERGLDNFVALPFIELNWALFGQMTQGLESRVQIVIKGHELILLLSH